jgi:hypothetical protein
VLRSCPDPRASFTSRTTLAGHTHTHTRHTHDTHHTHYTARMCGWGRTCSLSCRWMFFA